ncbi:MAG TPA: flagellar motor protein MotB [Anaerolineaceae bacterium]
MSHGGGGEDGDPNRWLVSYADFITLLMVLFVVLYSMGQTDVKKYKQLADSLKASLGGGGGPVKVVDSNISQGSGGSIGESNPVVIPGIPKRSPDSLQVASALNQLLTVNGLGNQVNVQTNVDGSLLSVSDKIKFVGGTADIQPQSLPVLDSLATMLSQVENKIRVVGYTDNTLPTDKRYPNNMELSFQRANSVASYLIRKGIKADRFVIAGVGENVPLFPNDTAENRAMNNRVEIIIVYKLQSDVVGSASTGAPTPVAGNPGGIQPTAQPRPPTTPTPVTR